MSLSQRDLDFLKDHHSAAMITSARDGTPKVARVGVALVDDKLWSSGTQDRVRTKRLRRDSRCTLFVFDHPGWGWVALESTVTILDGPDAPAHSLRMFRQMQGRPSGPLSWFGGELDEEAFLQQMVDEQRLIYEFDVMRSYGMR
jgi:PPOX class probable F420-dependent enzyme